MYLDTDLNSDEMKQLSFQLKSQHKNTCTNTSLSNNKPLISLMISEDLMKVEIGMLVNLLEFCPN